MLYLHWIYAFVGALTGIFVHIFFYQRFESVLYNTFAQAVFFFGMVIGFSLVGAVFAAYRVNMKWGYIAAFVLMCASYLFLFGDVTKESGLLFMALNGFGQGLYWLTLHTFELTETHDHERDYYSSVLSAGDQFIDLAAPALATALFFLSDDVLGWGSYTLLFIVSPLVFLFGLFFFRSIRTYRPAPMDWDDVVHFFRDRRNQLSHVYFLSGSANYAFSKLAVPIAAIMFLGTEKNVGLYSVFFAVLSMFALLALSKRRHSGNRLRFLYVTCMLSALVMAMVALWFNIYLFIFYSLVFVVLKPLQRVSAHVIDLETMETLGRKEKDFFSTMVLRDVALGFWRLLSLALFAILILVIGEGETAVRASFALLALSFALTYFGGLLLYRGRT